MKFIIIRDNLRDGLFIVERVETENLNLPILKNILVEADQNRIRLVSTNLEVAITHSTSGKVIEPGKFTVPAKLFSSVMRNIESERLNIETRGTTLRVSTDDYEAGIQGLPADDFPPTPKVKNQDVFREVGAGVLREALGQVLVSSQPNDLRPELNSVLFEFAGDSLKIAATDSFRLSEKTILLERPAGGNSSQHSRILVPLKTAGHVARAYADDEIVRMCHDENQILFKTDHTELLSRLVEGVFPEYAAIIPQKFDAEVVVDRVAFANAIKLVGVLSNKNNEMKFKIQENKKVLEITSSSDALGQNAYILSAKITGAAKEIVFNWKYIADALRVMTSAEVFFGINKENEPAELKPIPDASYFYILKPISGV